MKKVVFISGWAETKNSFDTFWQPYWDLKKISPCSYSSLEKQQSPSFYVREIAEEITTPCIIIAWSLGAMIAQELAVIKPEVVEKLIILNSTSCFIKKEDNILGVDIKLLRSMKLGLLSNRVKTLSNFFSLVYDTNDEILLSKKIEQANEFSSDQLLFGLDYFLEADLRDLKLGLKGPIYILHSKQDKIINPQLSKEIFQRFDNKSLIEINANNHAFFKCDIISRVIKDLVDV